jgi:hypothetical protein
MAAQDSLITIDQSKHQKQSSMVSAVAVPVNDLPKQTSTQKVAPSTKKKKATLPMKKKTPLSVLPEVYDDFAQFDESFEVPMESNINKSETSKLLPEALLSPKQKTATAHDGKRPASLLSLNSEAIRKPPLAKGPADSTSKGPDAFNLFKLPVKQNSGSIGVSRMRSSTAGKENTSAVDCQSSRCSSPAVTVNTTAIKRKYGSSVYARSQASVSGVDWLAAADDDTDNKENYSHQTSLLTTKNLKMQVISAPMLYVLD